MGSYSTTLATAQDGYTSGGVWDGTSATMGGNIGNPLGLRFPILTNFDAQSRPIAPPRIWPSLTLTLYTSAVVTTSSLLTLWFVPEAAPAAYSDSLLPTSRSETRFFINGVDTNDGFVSTSITADTPADTAITLSVADTRQIIEQMGGVDWNGFLCLTVTITTLGSVTFHTADGATAAFAPTLTTTEAASHTGVLNGPAFGRRARSRLDPKTGVPVASDEMIRDGYREGLMVAPWSWDPEAPEDRYVPSPYEGVVDDEV